MGGRIANRVSREQLLRVVSVLLLAIGVSLVARALAG